jgi:hypothetical protein
MIMTHAHAFQESNKMATTTFLMFNHFTLRAGEFTRPGTHFFGLSIQSYFGFIFILFLGKLIIIYAIDQFQINF